jgi:tetratricopeptide (TPR) repeat protein
MRRVLAGLLLGAGLLVTLRAADADSLLRSAAEAEAKQDSRAALTLLEQADALRPGNGFILQKIARQYSDMALEQPTVAEKKRYAQTALDYSQRAVAVDPKNPVNVLSLAVCHGKLALYSDTRTKVRYSRLVRDDTERALALDPNYAWAHHVLGRWHVEIATLGFAARVWVRMFYGGLPEASVDEGIRQLQRAAELEPGELNHSLELGFAYAAGGRRAESLAAWQHGLAMPSRGPHDEFAKRRAQDALTKALKT